jgi:hypothetical protein
MSDYQAAIEAAERLRTLPSATMRRLQDRGLSATLYDVPELIGDAITVARMLLRNHAIAHGEKPPP